VSNGKRAREKNDFDYCYCGDFRRQHKDGKGSCALNTFGHTISFDPGDKCMEFRLSERYKLKERMTCQKN
jgi:hypothetical protein